MRLHNYFTLQLLLIGLTLSPVRGAVLTTLYSLNSSSGITPTSEMLIDQTGNLYGTTTAGGPGGKGTVFKYSTSNNAISVIGSFDGTNGNGLAGGLFRDATGNFYGCSGAGGAFGSGTIYKIDASTGTMSILHDFNGTDGSSCWSSLNANASGVLFGATFSGGTSNVGTFFQYDTNNHAFTSLIPFANNTANGNSPKARPFIAPNGDIYQTTAGGGSSQGGTIFKYSPATQLFQTVVSFISATGSAPNSGFVADSNGMLYGTTTNGGTSGNGTIYRYDINTGIKTTLYNFTNSTNGKPNGELIIDAAGNIFGTSYSITPIKGMAWKYSISTNSLTILATFAAPNGLAPRGGLVADTVGNLYGTTWIGGTSSGGTIYKISDAGFIVPEPTALCLFPVATICLLRRSRAS